MRFDISLVDANFLKGSALSAEEFEWRNVQSQPFEIRGLAVAEGERFVRLPVEELPKYSEGVQLLSYHTAGGRVRFRTDSARVAVRVKSLNAGAMSHMPLTGSAGVDIYKNGAFAASVRPATGDGGWYEGVYTSPGKMAQYEVNMPLYNGLTAMLIGLTPGAKLLAPEPYRYDKPIVYYGSSITQGGCASRPGNSYQGFLSRWLNADQINLGFSGNGRGEAEMAQYIAGLEMSAFVLDYDHNAPSAEHLERTHEAFFKIIRERHPLLPVVFVSKPDFDLDPVTNAPRREIIYRTYENARKNGDKHVYFVDGQTLFGEGDRDACTVDGCHPNDLGFYRMAQAIYPALKAGLESAEDENAQNRMGV